MPQEWQIGSALFISGHMRWDGAIGLVNKTNKATRQRRIVCSGRKQIGAVTRRLPQSQSNLELDVGRQNNISMPKCLKLTDQRNELLKIDRFLHVAIDVQHLAAQLVFVIL